MVKFATRTLFEWEDAPASRPAIGLHEPGAQEAHDTYQAMRWIDDICRIVGDLPVMRGMLEVCPALRHTPISFVDGELDDALAVYDRNTREIKLNLATLLQASLSDGLIEIDTFDLHSVFTLLHEFRHAYQNMTGVHTLSGDMAEHINPFAMLFNELSAEADATAFALTGLYELTENPDITGLDSVDLFPVFEKSPERSSIQAFADALEENPDNANNGVASQRAFQAYFSKENAYLLNSYARNVSEFYGPRGLLPEKPVSLSAAFARVSVMKDFTDGILGLGGMPSINKEGDVMLRSEYMNKLPLAVFDVIKSLDKNTLSDLKLKIY